MYVLYVFYYVSYVCHVWLDVCIVYMYMIGPCSTYITNLLQYPHSICAESAHTVRAHVSTFAVSTYVHARMWCGTGRVYYVLNYGLNSINPIWCHRARRVKIPVDLPRLADPTHSTIIPSKRERLNVENSFRTSVSKNLWPKEVIRLVTSARVLSK